MRAARDLFDGIGAGAPLVALLACAVMGVTVSIGERGWPGAASAPGLARMAPAGARELTAFPSLPHQGSVPAAPTADPSTARRVRAPRIDSARRGSSHRTG